jgi:hypothetical protein
VRIRGGRGLGDSIYLRTICEYFVRRGEKVTALSDYPAVFDGSGVKVDTFSRTSSNLVAHYTHGKYNKTTTQWQDVCKSAGVPLDLPLRFDWSVRNHDLIDNLLPADSGRPIILVHGGRAPYGRSDGFGVELMPGKPAFDAVLVGLQDCFLVRVGKGDQYPLKVDVDLNGSTSVSDLLDIASVCDGVVAQCSFAVPLAEVFGKPLLAVWAARGLASRESYVKATTPQKIFTTADSQYVMDDLEPERIRETVCVFRERLRVREAA